MPKMKTVKGASKRFKVKKSYIKRGSAFRSHLLTGKPQKRVRNLKAPKKVDKTNLDLVKRQLCLA